MNLIEDRSIALAAILQAMQQVQSLAREGTANLSVEETGIQSILTLDAVSSAAVFGGVDNLRSGLKLLAEGILVSQDAEHIEILRYVMSILNLQLQIARDRQRFQEFGVEIEQLSRFAKDEISTQCSNIYQSYLSPYRPQIIVQGEQEFLQQAEIPVRIRALLLAGIRAAVLWQQKGGGRFKMLWERTRMRNVALDLLGKH